MIARVRNQRSLLGVGLHADPKSGSGYEPSAGLTLQFTSASKRLWAVRHIRSDVNAVPKDSAIKVVGLGVIGGLGGTVLMDIVMMITFILAGARADLFFDMVGEQLGDGAVLGVVVHNIIGTTAGFGFSVAVLMIGPLELTSVRKGLLLGIALGAVTIPVGCVPMAIWLGESIVGVVSFSVLPHLVWGATVGWVVAYGLLRARKPSRQGTEAQR